MLILGPMKETNRLGTLYNSRSCDCIFFLQVTVSGRAYVDASSLHIIKHNIKYSLDIVLSLKVTYELIVIKMANKFCTDRAGNRFTRTSGSIFTLHLGEDMPHFHW